MAKVKLDMGVTLETTSPEEFDSILRRTQIDAEEREIARARAISWIRLPVLQGTATAGTLRLGSGQQITGPRDGFLWQIRRLCVQGLATGDVIGIYWDDFGKPPEWTLTAAVPQATFGKYQLTMREGTTMLAANIGTFTSTAQINIVGEVIELPTVMLGKLA